MQPIKNIILICLNTLEKQKGGSDFFGEKVAVNDVKSHSLSMSLVNDNRYVKINQ